MNTSVIEIKNLNKYYNHSLVLNDVCVNIKRGGIYGFIGQNGAGKTTLLRIITGLAFPSGGEVELFGKTEANGLEESRKRIGCMIEHSGLFPNLTAKENLEIQKALRGIADDKAIERVLKAVGMADTGKKKFKNFSMGMKQRLGIAVALLSNPELLILDEPLNGLDPVGIVEIRELLIKLNKERHLTILISSHILGELFMLATDYIIIHKGIIVDRLNQAQLTEKCKKHIIIETEDVELAKNVLKNKLKTENFIVMPDFKIKIFDFFSTRKTVAQAFYDENVLLTELSYIEETLESYFIHAIGGNSIV